MARSERLGEPLGRCHGQIDHGYVIGCFDADECDGFDSKTEKTKGM